MGNTLEYRLHEAIRLNDNSSVLKILLERHDLLNERIDKTKEKSALLLASELNAYSCIGSILKLNPDTSLKTKGNKTALTLAIEKDNILIVKALLQHGLDPKSQDQDGLNALDLAILSMSYRTALLLHTEYEMKPKDADFYIQTNKAMNQDSFNIPLFCQCLIEKTPREKTPSFYLSKKQKMSLETSLPDPNETWGNFFSRILNFKVYQPPLVDRTAVPKELKESAYMKMQTKLLEYQFNKKSKFALFSQSC